MKTKNNPNFQIFERNLYFEEKPLTFLEKIRDSIRYFLENAENFF